MRRLQETQPAPGLIAAGDYWVDRAGAWRVLWAALARHQEALAVLGIALAAFWLYAATLLPGIGNRDTAELQRVVPTLGLAHPTGYPLYTLLGWLWSRLPLGGAPAWRMNLFSAAAAALSVGLVYLIGRALGQRRAVATVGAAMLATSFSFWSQATIAEVYALAALIEAALILALLRWRAGRLPFWVVGLLLGLGLAHHRAIILLLPGLLLFLALGRRPRPAEAGAALVALLAPCLLYLYLPLRAAAGADPWQLLWDYASGADIASAWLDPRRLYNEGGARLLDLARRFIWPQFLPAGALLALLGAGRLLRRDRASAALLLAGYVCVCAFCAAYYVDDVEVFFIPAHLLAAPLIAEGAILLRLPRGQGDKETRRQGEWPYHQSSVVSRQSSVVSRRWSVIDRWSLVVGRWSLVGGRWSVVDLILLVLPALLLAGNLGAIRAANSPVDELAARALLAEPLPLGALVIGDWSSIEGPHYLQAIEGLRPDLQFGMLPDRSLILDTLARGRAVYLLKPDPELGLAQQPAGQLWRVGEHPLAVKARAAIRWDEGIMLSGYTLPKGPYQPGAAVPVTLAWQAYATPQLPYTLFVHLVAADGRIWGQIDRPPAGAPTDRWRPGDQLIDLYAPVLDPAAPPGRYRVTIGWYAYPPTQRLHLAAGAAALADDYVTLGEIEVAPAR